MAKDFDAAQAAEHGFDRDDWNEVSDNPPWGPADMARSVGMSEALPDLHAALAAARRHGPARTKTPITIRLDDAVVSALRATGPGWQTRVNDVLKDWLSKEGS